MLCVMKFTLLSIEFICSCKTCGLLCFLHRDRHAHSFCLMHCLPTDKVVQVVYDEMMVPPVGVERITGESQTFQQWRMCGCRPVDVHSVTAALSLLEQTATNMFFVSRHMPPIIHCHNAKYDSVKHVNGYIFGKKNIVGNASPLKKMLGVV